MPAKNSAARAMALLSTDPPGSPAACFTPPYCRERRFDNVPSFHLRPGDIVEVRGQSKDLELIKEQIGKKTDVRKFGWLEFNPDKMRGVFLAYPDREQIPEKLNEQLIVELYSK